MITPANNLRLTRSLIVFIPVIGALLTTPSMPVAAAELPVAAPPSSPQALKCRRVSHRFSVCGDTNFKNKFVAGFGIHFSTIDPGGRLNAVGTRHEIGSDAGSCSTLLNETAVPAAVAKEAVTVCKEMVAEHRAVARSR